MENKQEKSQEDMVKEAVEEAKKSAAEAKEAETDTDETTETSEKVENEEADETAKEVFLFLVTIQTPVITSCTLFESLESMSIASCLSLGFPNTSSKVHTIVSAVISNSSFSRKGAYASAFLWAT